MVEVEGSREDERLLVVDLVKELETESEAIMRCCAAFLNHSQFNVGVPRECYVRCDKLESRELPLVRCRLYSILSTSSTPASPPPSPISSFNFEVDHFLQKKICPHIIQ